MGKNRSSCHGSISGANTRHRKERKAKAELVEKGDKQKIIKKKKTEHSTGKLEREVMKTKRNGSITSAEKWIFTLIRSS